jgi:hypothetical protein
MTRRIHTIEFCGEDECPSRGSVERINRDGVPEREPFCYKKARKIPEVIGTDGFEDFPNWCPLEVVP